MRLQRYWDRFFKPSVPIVRIDTPYVDPTTTANVAWRLSKINKKKAKAVAVYIDTHGGSIAQCEIIRDKIKKFCEINSLPLYTFAGTRALGGGYYLLTMGDKIYASNYSVIGGIDTHQNILDFRPLMGRWGIEDRFFTSEKFLYQETMLGRGVSEENIKPLQEFLEKRKSNLTKSIDESNRTNSKPASIEKVLDQSPARVLLGRDAINSGLVDSIGTIDTVLKKEFPKALLIDLERPSAVKRARSFFKRAYNIMTSKWLFVIFWGYMIGSTVVEIYIALLGLKYTYFAGSKKKDEKAEDNTTKVLNNK